MILGAIACVLAVAAGIGLGWNGKAWTAEPPLQTRFAPQTTCAVYLLIMLAGVAGTCLALGVVG